ncbi:nucleotide exchange factor GrpE [Salinirubrum litoreum]|uniref:Protein GrpE n=1 Tax=Salinirubrum litoreum TaxID=1126234 RepID=A0ABD5R835_9EURY|nr:nucleotide exchange factor GrpE [Salinirubrum litoreum]
MTEDADETAGTAETADTETDADPASDGGATELAVDPDDVIARAEDADPALADDVRELVDRVAELESELADRDEEIEDLEGRLKRKQADFQNYKKRAKKRQDQIRDTATEDFVERVVPVRDNLVRALDQPEGADIRGGVESTLAEFDRVLEEEGVEVIDPQPGEDVDPQRHEVMMRTGSDQPEDTVASTFEAGYEMGGSVIRAAKITVSDGPAEGETGDDGPAEETTDADAE